MNDAPSSPKPYVMIGIPTWCEAKTIKGHIEAIDSLMSDSVDYGAYIIAVADNRSPDETRDAALSASVRQPIVFLETAQGVRGKGANFELLFRHSLFIGADVLITLDADLEIVPVDWIVRMVHAVNAEHCDLAIPLYPRFWYDGNLTNQIVSPLVLAITGTPIRQPIAGDFAFSPRALRHLLSIDWPARVFGFGIDVFCVLRCLRDGLRVEQVPLSTGKVHSWRSDTSTEVADEMEIKFDALVGSLLDELNWQGWQPVGTLPVFPEAPPLLFPPKDYHYEHLVELAAQIFEKYKENSMFRRMSGFSHSVSSTPSVGDEVWEEVLTRVVCDRRADRMDSEHYKIFMALFFMRMATAIPTMRQAEVDARSFALASGVHRRLKSAPLSSAIGAMAR